MLPVTPPQPRPASTGRSSCVILLGSRLQTFYVRRNDVESINRAIDDHMWQSRAHSVSHARQHLNLIGYALMVNSLALLEHRQRAAPLAA